jgi:Domain of unknown function (DUF4192)
MTADITLRGPDDVVAALPYQLGYHPHDSVVVVSLRRRRVGLVARCDLPAPQHLEEVVTSLLGPLLRDRPTSVVLVGYEEVAEASHPVLLALVDQVERAGVEVVDVAVVRGGRRYSPICSEPCCPPEGVALRDPADVPVVAEFVALGRSPLPSRTAVEHLVEPEPWRCTGVARAVDSRSRMPRRRRRAAAAWAEVLAPGVRGRRPADRCVVADLALGLADVPWRDGLIAWLAPSVLPADEIDPKVAALLGSALPRWAGMGPPVGPPQEPTRAEREARVTERDDLLHRLLALCRSVPDECPHEAAAVCTVAAHVAWVAGDGAVARVALERAVRLAPGYRLAELLVRLVDTGLRLPPLPAGARPDEGLGRVG